MEYAVIIFCTCLAGMGILRKTAEVFDRADNFWDRMVGVVGLMFVLIAMVAFGFVTMFFIS